MQNALQAYYNNSNLNVLSISFEPASGIGDGYCGILLRVFVEFESKTDKTDLQRKTKKSFILKTNIWDDLSAKTLKRYNIVPKELTTYESVLPAIKVLLQEIGVTLVTYFRKLFT